MPRPPPERSDDITVYLVLNDYGKLGSVVAFNTAEGWSWDVSEDIAHEILQRAIEAGENFGRGYQAFHRPACRRFHAPRPEPSANQPGRADRPAVHPRRSRADPLRSASCSAH
jgi:hypothetical protein